MDLSSEQSCLMSGLQGPGTGTSDSIPALLSAGESVMTANETGKHHDLLMAIRKKSFDDYINERYILPELAKANQLNEMDAKSLMMAGSAIAGDGSGLVHAIQSSANKRNRNEDKNSQYLAN